MTNSIITCPWNGNKIKNKVTNKQMNHKREEMMQVFFDEYTATIKYFDEKIEVYPWDDESCIDKRLYWMQKKNEWQASWNERFGKEFLTEEEILESKKPPTLVEFCDLVGWDEDMKEMWHRLYDSKE